MVIDRNKAAYKLKGLPPIFYINMDTDDERRQYMEDQFKYWEITKYQRVSGSDGRKSDLSEELKGKYPPLMTSKEVGCTLSHLRAIKQWLDSSDSETALIIEDDLNMDIAKFWNFTWKDFVCQLPYDWDVVQLAIISTTSIHIPIHKRFVNDFSTAAYMISKHHAEKLIKHHYVGNDKWKLDNGVKPRAVADDLIYNAGNTYSMPLFSYRLQLGSSIHPEHVDLIHKGSHEGVLNFWQNHGYQIPLEQLMDYNPWLGRIAPTQEQIDQANAANQAQMMAAQAK